MEQFLYYLLRASVVMTLFYGFYKLLFGKNTFYRINRIVLILLTITVCTIPIFRFSILPEKKHKPIITENITFDFSEIPVVEYNVEPQIVIPWLQVLLVVFIVGFLFAITRYIIGLAQLRQIIQKSEKQTLADNSILCITEKDVSPFSWFKYIVLSHTDIKSENSTIINHEQAHIHLLHSLDMIFFDLFTCVFWFNPFSWLLRLEIQSVHEYQADEKVLQNGIDAKQYQLLLIRKSVGEHKFSLANNFRQRDLHKRIRMMTKNKTNKRMKWGYSVALPMLFLAMAALSIPKLNAKVTDKDLENISEEKSSLTITEKSDDTTQTPLELEEVQILDKKEQTKVEKRSPNVPQSDKEEKPLYVLDGVKIIESLENINSEIIQSISLLKGNSATDVYGKKAKNGAVVIITKNGSGLSKKTKGTTATIDNPEMTFRENSGKALIVVDEEIKGVGYELNSIETNEIDSIHVLKDSEALKLYGKKGKDGVIKIYTKSNKTLD